MITITPLAHEKLSSYLDENKVAGQIRIYMPEAGCGGGESQISLTLDQPDTNDITVKVGDLELFMAKTLSEQTGKVVIDFKDTGQDSGFVVETEKSLVALPADCAGCTYCD